jgi:hypothetical protein
MDEEREITFNIGKARWWQSDFDKLRGRIAAEIGVNWETVQANAREAGFPPPPYKEPLMYVLFASGGSSIPWRQAEKVAIRLRDVVLPLGLDFAKVLELAEGLEESYRKHRTFEVQF